MTRKEQIEEFIKFHAHKFSVRNGYETIEELMREMAQWCDNNPKSPWISVDDSLPEIGDTVVINVHHTIDGGGEHHEDDQILVEKFDGRWLCDRCEQHRMGKHLFDTISKTTHWMPIPQIKKGGEK